jgi:hypothetical protein
MLGGKCRSLWRNREVHGVNEGDDEVDDLYNDSKEWTNITRRYCGHFWDAFYGSS